MKNRFLSLLFAAAFAVIGLGSFSGCAINPKADKIAVSAEAATNTSWDVLDAFVHLEYNHRAQLEQYFGPSVHKAANEIRKHGRQAVSEALDLVEVYQANRTPENKANLTTGLAVVRKLTTQAIYYMNQTQQKNPSLVSKVPAKPEVLRKAAAVGL